MTDRETPPAGVEEKATSGAVDNGDIAGEGAGSGEVRAVQKRQGTSNAALLLGVLLLIALIGGAFFLVQSDVSSRAPQLGGDEPKRYSIDKVEEEVVAAQTVAAVAVEAVRTKPAVEKKTGAVETKPEPVVKPVAAEPSGQNKQSEKAVVAERLYQVQVGPFLYVNDTTAAEQKLRQLGHQGRKIDGRGSVTMYRLQEGRYPAADARAKLPEVKRLAGAAFLLPEGEQLAIYVGSFSDRKRAESYQQALLEKGLNVTTVASEIEMSGKMFIVGEAELPQARAMAAKLTDAGFEPEVVRK